jgi:hypothetical protein
VHPCDRRFIFSFGKWHQGDAIVICPQRGVTPNDPDISHGQDWADSIVPRIREFSDRPILWKARKERPCLPSDTSDITIVEDIPNNPWCVVVYSSNIAVPLLQAGTPIICDGPTALYKPLTGRLEDIENPPMPSRHEHFNKMMNTLSSRSEINNGTAFTRLLDYHESKS